MRERLNGYYPVSTFVIANTVASLPFIWWGDSPGEGGEAGRRSGRRGGALLTRAVVFV
jgi:hypothetical protein